MDGSFTVRLPDGNEYGPADLPALRAWLAEGRIGPDTLVWREGSADWRPLAEVLGAAEAPPQDLVVDETVTVAPRPSPEAAPSAEAAPPAAPLPATADAQPVEVPKPLEKTAKQPVVRTRPPGASISGRRARPSPWRIVVPLLAVALLAGAGFAWWTLTRPARERQRAEAEVLSYAAPERGLTDEALGLRVEVPEGWVVLRPDHPFFHAPEARLRLAHPTLRAFARLGVLRRLAGPTSLDAALDRALADWRLLVPALQEEARTDAAVAGATARRATVAWSADGQDMRGTAVVFRDGWNDLGLLAWGPAQVPGVNPAIDALVSQVKMSGRAVSRIREAADAVAGELPELSRAALEAIVERRLAAGEPTDDLPQSSLRVVSRGLRALNALETQEMGQIYAEVYKPLKEQERARLAAWLAQVRAGSPVDPDEGLAMRQALRDALLALPEDIRARLQQLNEKAVLAALGANLD